jgi:putative spermidine/putrescine transport system ATP-binding protein
MTVPAASSQAVRLDRVTVHYREIVAVQNVSLTLAAGEILALLGPSGCGKTTLLRSIAGFVPHSGEIHVGGKPMARVASHRRNIGMVFQDYALFPHMTVAQNVGFGLKMRGLSRAAIVSQVGEMLALVGLEGFQERMVRQLSGGQQQRVALARALVIKPALLLLDEPLSALDKKLREEMRGELKRIQRLTGVTTIFVTHDQDEALALADRLALMHRGTLLQFGGPEEVYRRPAGHFVAEFLGAANRARAACREVGPDFTLLELPGAGLIKTAIRPAGVSVGQSVVLYVRPEQIRVTSEDVRDQGQGLPATLVGRTYLGRHRELTLRLRNGAHWMAHVADDDALSKLKIGATVVLQTDPARVIVFGDAEDGASQGRPAPVSPA